MSTGTQWLVYVEMNYYPFAKIVTASSGEEAIQIVADHYGTDRSFDRPEPGRPLVIAVPYENPATNRIDQQNAPLWDELRLDD